VCNFILKAKESLFLRDVLQLFNRRFCYIDDPAIYFDIDTQEDPEKANSNFIKTINMEKKI